MPPPKIWMPNFPLRLKLKAPPKAHVEMPPVGTEGVFKTKELVFETVQQMTKIEIKQFLQAVYGIDVNRVHSVNVMGKRKGEMTSMPVQEKDFKRFYVKLKSDVELPNIPKQLDQLKTSATTN